MSVLREDIVNIDVRITNLLTEVTLSEEIQKEIGDKVVEDFDSDFRSRTQWAEKRARWLKLFMQYTRPKSYPWDNCSNVVLPLLSTAAIQFQARAYDSLMPAKEKVKIPFTGLEDGLKADRVAHYMNHQIDYDMEDFEEGFDVSLMQLPIDGSVFRKTFHDPSTGNNRSVYCSADEIVVPYRTNPTDMPSRITHILKMYEADLKERELSGIFVNVSKGYDDDDTALGPGSQAEETLVQSAITETANQIDKVDEEDPYQEKPRVILEQHRMWDLDGDGIREPYIFTVDKETKRVLRIVKRQYYNTITNKIVIIDYFTHYYFLPNPEGYYGLGFGHLLEAINESASSIMNQIIDAGHLAIVGNMSGFYNKNSGVKSGDLTFKLGQFKGLDIRTDDINKAIKTFDFRGPDVVLFNVLGMLHDYNTRVTTVTESMTGEMPSSDTPASLGLATIEQGMKVFSTIHKRIHRGLKKEYKKIFILNGLYGDNNKYLAVLGDQRVAIAQQNKIQIDILSDFGNTIDVVPTSDPNILSRQERISIAQTVLATTLSNPYTANNPEAVYAAHVKFFKAIGEEDINSVYPPPPPPPDLSQIEENSKYFTEEYVSPLPHQAHEEHINILRAFMVSPFATNLTPNGKNLAERHLQEHLGMLYLKLNGELQQ